MDRRHLDLSLIGGRWLAGGFGAALCGLGLLACGQQVPNAPAPVASQLCSDDFKTCVMPVLSRPIRRAGGSVVSCSDSNCHALGGNGGRFTLGPDDDANFLSVSNFVNRTNPDASLLLIEPAADSVLSSPAAAFHGGGDIFPSSSDACFQALRAWIANQAACGSCVPVPNNVNCGYP
jgi:hypothetical protein